MQILHAHVYWSNTKQYPRTCSAEIDVPGLGKVNIDNFISDDLRNRIEAEAIFCLEQRLGISHKIIEPITNYTDKPLLIIDK